MPKIVKLSNAETQKRYREKRKLDKARDEEYKRKHNERNSERLKRSDMPKKLLISARAKERAYKRIYRANKKEKKTHAVVLIDSSSESNNCITIESAINSSLYRKISTRSQTNFTPSSSNLLPCIKQRRTERYQNELSNKNKKLQQENELLKFKLKEAKKKQEKYKKRNLRLKKQMQQNLFDSSDKGFISDCQDVKKKLVLLKQKYKEISKKNNVVIASKILKRYKLKAIMGCKKENITSPISKKRSMKMSQVYAFFLRDDVSRASAGKKETITRGKMKKQKRYLCDTMKRLYKTFKTENQKLAISYTTFTRLKPFWIRKPVHTDRNTCACQQHANIKLKTSKLFHEKVISDQSLETLLKDIMCSDDSAHCAWSFCKVCKSKKIVVCNTNLEKTCKWFQWEIVNEERHNKKKDFHETYRVQIIKKVEKVTTLASLIDKYQVEMQKFKKHVFNVKNQYNASHFCKQNLRETEAMMHIDFSENYSCKLSEEVQMFHFGASRNQATLHTGLIYLKSLEKPINFCTISESLHHGPGAIWAHLDPIFDFLKQKAPNITTIHFFSDSPSSQYRQKNNFFLLCNRFFDKKFKCATWSFFETSHGKGAADGVGAVLKRTADSLVAHGMDIMDAHQFYDALKGKVNVELFFVNAQQISCTNKLLPKNLKTIQGTRNIHQIVSCSKGTIMHRNLSCYCANNNWLKGRLCNCHGLKAKTVKIEENSKRNPSKKIRSVYKEVYTDSE